MAKGSYRQRKKKEKEKLQRELVSQKQLTKKELKRISFKSLQSITEKLEEEKQQRKKEEEQKKQQKKQSRKEYIQKTRQFKKEFLEIKGIDPFQFSLKQLDSIKLKDIRNNRFSEKTYPQFYPKKSTVTIPKGFDFEKKVKLKNGERMYFAFRDFTGETCFGDIIEFHKQLSNEELLERLWKIATKYPTYNKKEYRISKKQRGGSSGSAGDFKYICSSSIVIKELQSDVYNTNRRKRTKEHTGDYKGFQVLKNGGRNSYDVVSPRGLLIIANSIMWNITEWDRIAFYKNFRSDVEEHLPEFAKLLPPPLELS